MRADPTTRCVRKILREHAVRHVEILASSDSVVARAHPDSFHPLVAKRRTEALQKAADAEGTISLAAASKAAEGSMTAVAQSSGATIEEAVLRLLDALRQSPAIGPGRG